MVRPSHQDITFQIPLLCLLRLSEWALSEATDAPAGLRVVVPRIFLKPFINLDLHSLLVEGGLDLLPFTFWLAWRLSWMAWLAKRRS